MTEFLQQLVNGLAIGGIYALVALGYTMVYGVLKLINFAHGELFTIGAYLGFTLLVSCGLSSYSSTTIAAVLVFLVVFFSLAILGALLERIAYRPLRKAGRLSVVVSALGASIFLQNAVMLLYGPRAYVYPESFRPALLVNVFGAPIPIMRIIVLLSGLALMLALYVFVNKTRLGRAIRAVALDQEAATLMGVNVNRIIALVFFIGAGLGGVAGVMVGTYYGRLTFTMGWTYGLKAFTAAILGGIGNIPGAMLGGLLIGLLESFSASYIAIAWKDAVVFFVLIIVLVFRPTGLLGEKTADKL